MIPKRNDTPQVVRRIRMLAGGVIEERSAAMGRVLTVPADPRRRIDLSVDSAGWERWQTFRRRFR
jgi:hypothetical protein